jgi:hypothetical protein
MRKLLTMPALLLLSMTAVAHIGFSENPDLIGTGKVKEGASIGPGKITNEDEGLWLLTAKITRSHTSRQDTVISFEAESYKSVKEKHSESRTVSHGEITAVIENMASDPPNEFYYDTDPGVPKSITVSGQGSYNSSSNYQETINGKMISATIGNINVSGAASPEVRIYFYYSEDSKSVDISIPINGKGSDKGRMFYDEWKDTGGEIDHYYIQCSGGCDISSDNNCKITKSGSGYRASWKKTENRQRHTVDGTEFITDESTLDLTISPYKEPDKPEVTLYGCSELSREEQSDVMASGKPGGGKFRFWVEPSNLLNVQSDGESSAILTGGTPGKGTLYVEYTSPEGKTNTTSQPASCVQIENYNNGQDIPQIPLFDIDGKKLSGKLTIPLSAQPANIEELVDFVPADKTVLSAAGLSGAVALNGSRTGKTTLQAKTNCGTSTGPAVEVEVVNCDKETVEALERMRKTAVENLQEAADNLQKVAGSKEFEKARDDLTGSAVELLAKAGLTIIASGKSPSAAVNTATKIAEAGSAISDMIGSASQGEFYENAVKTAFEELNGEVAGAITGVAEVYQAAKRFGENAGEILKHEEVLKSAMESWEKANRDLKRIEQLQQICKGDKTEPQKQEEPKADQTPEPNKPTPPKEPKPPVEPKPKTDTPPGQKPPTEQPTPKPGDEEPPVSPPPPTSEPRQVGLPYSPEECGCGKTQSISVSSAGFASLQAGVKNIGDCVEKFNSIAVTDYSITLKELDALTDTLKTASGGDPAIFKVKAKEAKPRLDSLIERTKSYDEAGKTFLKQFEKCPESVSAGMDVLKSALTVTVDSIKTKY